MTAIEALHQVLYDRLTGFSPWPVIDSSETVAEPPCIVIGEARANTVQGAGIPNAYEISFPITSVAPGDSAKPLNALMATVYEAIDEASIRAELLELGWNLTALSIDSQSRGAVEPDGLRSGEQTVEALMEPVYEVAAPVPEPCGSTLREFCIGAWDMRTLEGTAIRDLSGIGNHLQPSPTGVSIVQSGVTLNGSSGYLRAPAFAAGGGVTTTAIAVVRYNSLLGGGSLVHIGVNTADGGNYLAWYAASNAVLYAMAGKSGGYDTDSPSSGLQPIVDGTFRSYGLGYAIGTGMYVTRWWRNETYEQKIRGTQVLAHSIPGLTVGVIWANTAPRSTYPYYLNGTIAWLSLFSKQLSDSEYQTEFSRIRMVLSDRGVSI